MSKSSMKSWFSNIVEIAADKKKFTRSDDEMSNRIYDILSAAERITGLTSDATMTLDDFWGVFVRVVKPRTGKKSFYGERYRALRALLAALHKGDSK